jgi:uncharacterized membrane protein YgcG
MSIYGSYRKSLYTVLVLICLIVSVARSENNVSLMVQKTPSNGGSVTPDVGVHQVGSNGEVTLRAIPKPGYQFVYWIGDVADSTSPATVAYTNGPKIIIAVFERVNHAYMARMDRSTSTPHQHLIGSSDFYTGSSSGGGGSNGGGGGGDTPSNDPIPVPSGDDDFPVPVPEPATCVFLAGGIAILMRKMRNRK